MAWRGPLTYVLYMLSMVEYMSATSGRAEAAGGICQRPGFPGRGRGRVWLSPAEERNGRRKFAGASERLSYTSNLQAGR